MASSRGAIFRCQGRGRPASPGSAAFRPGAGRNRQVSVAAVRNVRNCMESSRKPAVTRAGYWKTPTSFSACLVHPLRRHSPVARVSQCVQDVHTNGRGQPDIFARRVNFCRQVIQRTAFFGGEPAKFIPEDGFERDRCAMPLQGQAVLHRPRSASAGVRSGRIIPCSGCCGNWTIGTHGRPRATTPPWRLRQGCHATLSRARSRRLQTMTRIGSRSSVRTSSPFASATR